MSKIEKYSDDKSEFFSRFAEMRPDLYYLESWDDEQKRTVDEIVHPKKLRTAMFASIPMVCRAKDCTFADMCPLMKQNLAPKGKKCPIEMSAAKQFMESFMEELDINPENLIEVSMIRDLVDQEIQYMRKTWLMSKEHFIQENVVGVYDGEVVMQKQLHLAVELEDKLLRRKKEIRNQLLATREARAKVGQAQLDTAQAISKVMDDVRKAENAKRKALNAKLGYEDEDEYLEAELVDPSDKED